MIAPARRAAALGLLVVVMLAGCAGSRSAASSSGDGATADLPPPTRQTLRNGMRLVVQEHRAADIAAIYLFVGTGSRYETPDELGYAHFQEHMLFKGTDRFGPGYIDRTIEGVGGRSNAVTSFDYTTFYFVVPTEATTRGIELLADMAFRSTFAPDEVTREREVIFEEARIEQDNARTAIVRQLYGLVFAGHAYGRPVLGTRETMSAATQERLRAFNRRWYVPDNMTLVVAGPVDAATMRAVAERTFGRQPATGYKSRPLVAPRPLGQTVRRTVERDEQQAYLALGWQAPRSDDSAGDAVDLLSTILAGTESSRLARRLRDQERLVSSVTMSYSALMEGGIVALRADLEARDLPRAEAIILEEIARIQETGPTEEDRRLALTKFEAQHAFDTETSEGLAYAYGLAETTWTLDAELRYVERLRRVSREQIRDAARRYLSRTGYAQLAFVPKAAR
ncbi:MAG TPA: pitrilysin family protein [Methylomirabilota bacterium]|nr:pitrilysin family protein [Methylomirabilota bacterium]